MRRDEPWLDKNGKEISKGLVDHELESLDKIVAHALKILVWAHDCRYLHEDDRYEAVDTLLFVREEWEKLWDIVVEKWGAGDDPERVGDTLLYCNYYVDGEFVFPDDMEKEQAAGGD